MIHKNVFLTITRGVSVNFVDCLFGNSFSSLLAKIFYIPKVNKFNFNKQFILTIKYIFVTFDSAPLQRHQAFKQLNYY